MTPTQFLAAIKALGFPSPYAAAGAIGVSRQQAYRYADPNYVGEIPKPVQRLIEMYRRHGVPEEFL